MLREKRTMFCKNVLRSLKSVLCFEKSVLWEKKGRNGQWATSDTFFMLQRAIKVAKMGSWPLFSKILNGKNVASCGVFMF